MRDIRWNIKYGLFRRKFNESDVRHLLQYMDAKMSNDDVEKLLYLRTNRTRTQIKELLYIYKKMKGGMKQ